MSTLNKVELNSGGVSTVYKVGNVVEGYLDKVHNKFYEDTQYTTEINAESNIVYLSLDTNKQYRYDTTNSEFVSISGGNNDHVYNDKAAMLADLANVNDGDIMYTKSEQNESLSERVSELESGKQDKTDNTLATTSKTIVGAINEIENGLSSVNASDVSYTNTTSGLSATNVQGAIDEELALKQDKIFQAVRPQFTTPSKTWSAKTWSDLTNFDGRYVWTDGENIYYSNSTDQYVLDKSTSTWSSKRWSGLTNFSGLYIWTDGENIYYSNNMNQYVLDKSTSTWSSKTWSGLSIFGTYIWTDGENIYYSNSTSQYVLDKSTSTWNAKTWSGLSRFSGGLSVWADGENIYYSSGSNQYVLDKSTSTWNAKTWSGLTNFDGNYIWTDGENIYYSKGSSQYVLDKSTSTWNAKTWSGLSSFFGIDIWTDGENIYYSNETSQYVLYKWISIKVKPYIKA